MEPAARPDALVDGLQRHLAVRVGAPVQRLETHISWVLLAGPYAYKIKKPVKLPFLDFSTPQARRRCCEDEVRLNRRLAPSLYLDVVAIRASAGGPVLDGDGAILDHAVRMRRFPDGALLAERCLAGTLSPVHLDRLARRIAAFHAAAPAAGPEDDYGSAAISTAAAQDALQAVAALAPTGATDGLAPWLRAQAAALAPVWSARRAGGHVREAHGDLHLGNAVVLEDGDVTAFDCIEFEPALRWIDVLNDVGFLVMDLQAHGRDDLAFRFLDAYLAETGDYAGLPVLRFAMVYRALVRARVGLMRERQQGAPSPDHGAGPRTDPARRPVSGPATGPSAMDYLALARRLTGTDGARLLITCGLPGSGKSFVAQGLLERTRAIRLRSDVERKRAFGLAPLDDSAGVAGGIYGADATRRTYDRLALLADATLRAGWPTIVDAAFLRADERARFAALAQRVGAPFVVVHCMAEDALLRERVRGRATRRDDASEADEAVLGRLASVAEPLGVAEQERAIVVDTGRPIAWSALADRWRRAQ